MKITVNGLEIPEAVFEREMARARQGMQGAEEAQIEDVVKQNLIRQALVRQAAAKNGAQISPNEIEAAYRNLTANFGSEENFLKANGLTPEHVPMVKVDVEANMRVERFIAELTRYVVLPKEAMLREYHRRDKSVSVAPEEVHCAHIVKRPGPGVYESMVAIRKRLLNKEDFATVANECTECDEKDGDLGYVARGRMVEVFEDVIFSMQPGEVSPVFRSQFGYHIAKVYDFRAERALPYEECEERVKSAVLSQMKDAVVKDWIDKNLKTAKVDIA